MPRYVVLLRGINVGPTTKVAMADLRALLHDAGFTEVRTHLQSGNVLLTSRKGASGVQQAVEAAIVARLGRSIDVVLRTAGELQAIVAADPLGEIATDGSKRFVAFLAEPHDPGDVRAMAASVAERDEQVLADGREIYLWCPDGIRDSPLAKAPKGRREGPVVTVRNWNTVSRLAAMLDETP